MSESEITFDSVLATKAALLARHPTMLELVRRPGVSLEEALAAGLSEYLTLHGTGNQAERPLGVLVAKQ